MATVTIKIEDARAVLEDMEIEQDVSIQVFKVIASPQFENYL